MQSIVADLVDSAPTSETRATHQRASGFFIASELPLARGELAAAVAIAVHRGLLPQRRRSLLPMRG